MDNNGVRNINFGGRTDKDMVVGMETEGEMVEIWQSVP